jgi:YHS domain-containing protein
MKRMNQYILLAVCALGALASSTKLTAADSVMPSCGGGCGVGALPMAATTNAVPDRLTTCPVSGDKLDGDMGKPFVFIYKGQEVKLCCKHCKKDFDKNPKIYLAKIRAADKK